MQEAIEGLFSDRHKDDLAIVYFSGHGIKDESGKLYLATRLTRKNPQGQLIKSTLEEYKDKLPVLTNQPASATSTVVGAVTTSSSSSSSSALVSASSSSSSSSSLVEPVVSHTRTIIASETASELQSQRRFVLKKPRRILIRLRVEHSGFPTVNTVRLGTHFVNEVANPTDLILFAKQKAKSLLESRAVEGKNKKMTHGSLKLLLHEGAEEELQKIKINKFYSWALDCSYLKLLQKEYAPQMEYKSWFEFQCMNLEKSKACKIEDDFIINI
jgi:hypothetical protein